MLIKNKDIPNIVKALSLMASLGNTQQDGKAKAFSFKNPGKVRYDLARTFKRVQAAEEDLTAFQQSLFAQILAEQNADAAVPATQLNPEHVGKFNAAAAQRWKQKWRSISAPSRSRIWTWTTTTSPSASSGCCWTR